MEEILKEILALQKQILEEPKKINQQQTKNGSVTYTIRKEVSE